MIPKTPLSWQSSQQQWQVELRRAICDPLQLLNLLELPVDTSVYLNKQNFGLRVPSSYVARMSKGNPQDPLLQQVLPLAVEHLGAPGFTTDPVGDALAEKVPHLLHKYSGRVLLIMTDACAIHCRYCFRRYYTHSRTVFPCNPLALAYIRAETSITEVILSGGDPLCLPDKQLAETAQTLAKIPHVQRLRIHTRLPVLIPERVTQELLSGLTGTRLQPILVIHANHANEFNDSVLDALKRLVAAGITVLNQSVLLRGINDDVTTLTTLSETLFRAQVLPYYLHQLDRVQGAAHFEVPKEKAQQLIAQMRTHLPGYLVPKLVQEVIGMPYKQPLE